MSAKEMFEELGYKINETEFYIEYSKETYYIQFWKNKFFGITFHSLSGTQRVDKQELQAINKQVEELNWNA